MINWWIIRQIRRMYFWFRNLIPPKKGTLSWVLYKTAGLSKYGYKLTIELPPGKYNENIFFRKNVRISGITPEPDIHFGPGPVTAKRKKRSKS